MKQSFIIALLAGLFGVMACAGETTGPDLSGTWGGRHLELFVFEDSVRLEFECALGTIEKALRLDGSGRFDVAGVYIRGHGGPIREGEIPDEHPARYAGQVRGSHMELTVILTESADTVGSFSLTRGEPGRVIRCL
jgi:hypothetical protein